MAKASSWVKVAGWEQYEVSRNGQVRNSKTGCVLTPMRTGDKRPGSQRSKVRFSTTPRVDFDVAHLVLTTFVGPRPHGAVAMHLNDNSNDNRVSNLRWGSASDNARQAALRGRVGGQKLTAADVKVIKSWRSYGISGAWIARRFGVSQQRVCDIYKGRTSL